MHIATVFAADLVLQRFANSDGAHPKHLDIEHRLSLHYEAEAMAFIP